eukprot:jgi/Bigna1/127780/aug1.5_g2488
MRAGAKRKSIFLGPPSYQDLTFPIWQGESIFCCSFRGSKSTAKLRPWRMGISSFSGQAFHERLVDEGKEAEGAAPSVASLGAFHETMAYALLSGFGAFMFGCTMGFTSSTLPAMFGQNSRNVFVPSYMDGHCEDSHVSSYMGSLFSSIVNVAR